MKRGRITAAAILTFLALSLGLGAFAEGTTEGGGESYPSRPIELIIPFPAGGRTDLNARMWASVAHEHLGVPVAAINRTGGRGAPAAEFVLNAPADGYTIFAATIGTNILWPIQGIGNYEIFDFTPIGRIGASTMVLACAPSKPWQNIQDLVDDAKSRPREITYGAVKGAMPQLGFLIFAKAVGADFRHVAVEGDAPALSSALGGHIDLYVSSTAATVIPHAQAGTLRPLCVFSEERDPNLPDTPTLKELGIDAVAAPWTGIAVDKEVPPEQVAVLREAFDKTVKDNETFARLINKIGESVSYMSGEDFEEDWKKQQENYTDVLTELGMAK